MAKLDMGYEWDSTIEEKSIIRFFINNFGEKEQSYLLTILCDSEKNELINALFENENDRALEIVLENLNDQDIETIGEHLCENHFDNFVKYLEAI